MSSKIELPETGWVPLSQAMIWLAEDNGATIHTGPLSRHQENENAYELVGPKETFLVHARNGSARSRGKLRYISSVNLAGDDRVLYTRPDHEQIDPGHWPETFPSNLIDWESCQLNTDRQGVYIDIQIDVTGLRTRWKPPDTVPYKRKPTPEEFKQVIAWLDGPYRDANPGADSDSAGPAARKEFSHLYLEERAIFRPFVWAKRDKKKWRKQGRPPNN